MHISRHAPKFNYLLQVLFRLGLHAILERKQDELIPLVCVVHVERELVDELPLRVLNVSDSVEFLSQALVLCLGRLTEGTLNKLCLIVLNLFELSHNFDRQVSSVVSDGLGQALFELLLEEDVKLSFELVLLSHRQRLSTTDLLFEFFHAKSENGFLKTVTDFRVFVTLSEVVEEALTAALSNHLLLLGAQEGSLALASVVGVFTVRGAVLLLYFLGVLLAYLGNDVLDRRLIRGDSILCAGELLGLFELGKQLSAVSLDHSRLRVEGRVKSNSQVDVGLARGVDILRLLKSLLLLVGGNGGCLARAHTIFDFTEGHGQEHAALGQGRGSWLHQGHQVKPSLGMLRLRIIDCGGGLTLGRRGLLACRDAGVLLLLWDDFIQVNPGSHPVVIANCALEGSQRAILKLDRLNVSWL